MANEQLLTKLKERFNKYAYRHKNVSWEDIESKLTKNENLLNTVLEMEKSDGEPDVATLGGKLVYVDFSKETPKPKTSV